MITYNDQILAKPPQGKGASLEILYRIPRDTKNFVAYHKFAAYGSYDADTTEFSHYSNRPLAQLEKSLGQRIWVVGGEVNKRKTKYKLLSYFTPEAIRPAPQQVGWFVSGPGVGFEPPIELSKESWLDQLLKEQQNFSFGLNKIKSQSIIDGLLSLTWPSEAGNVQLAEEVLNSEAFTEGATRQITINAYERNPKARQACIKHYGASCQVCNLDFGKQYADLGRGFIHVHHLKPLYSINQQYEVDPINDLRPVCPNCHAMLHRTNPPFSIEELRKVVTNKF